uniref:VOC domain-containing protein n=1 Tax=Plectus sambesii TaxID=2011161 RepID=A0A914WJ70_9BILA
MRRALHYVFKIGDRKASYDFFTKTLGMQILRHEEFEEGCKATCNGPYNGLWSKTMVGYGAEDDHFVIELTYNYEVGSYKLGNDFAGIKIESSSILDRVRSSGVKAEETHDGLIVRDPDGHPFFLTKGESSGDPVKQVSVNVADLKKSTDYWQNLCGMNKISSDDKHSLLSFGSGQCALELRASSKPIERGTGFGRIAFSCPTAELSELEGKMKEAHQTIQTPLVALDTPGKATVHVVIFADPDAHEICFVGDEAFRELSKVDPKADTLLQSAIQKDSSADWFKHSGGKPSAS